MAEAQPTGGFDFNRPTIVALLCLVGIISAVPTLIAVVLAYIWRGQSHEPWEASHYRYLIRSFWIGLLIGVVGVLLSLVGIGLLILLVLPIWLAIRAIVSLAAAQRHAPVQNPESWLW